MDLITDNAKELPSAPFPDIPAEMPGVKLDCEQGVSAEDEPRVLSEDEELVACVDNANFVSHDHCPKEMEFPPL